MLNNGKLVTETLVNVKQILANDHFVAVGAILDNTAKNSDGKCLAGTPLTGDLLKRTGGADAFTKATTTCVSCSDTNSAKFVLLHDVEFDGTNDANVTVLVHGFVQKNKCDSTVQTLLDSFAVKALAANGIYVI